MATTTAGYLVIGNEAAGSVEGTVIELRRPDGLEVDVDVDVDMDRGDGDDGDDD